MSRPRRNTRSTFVERVNSEYAYCAHLLMLTIVVLEIVGIVKEN